MKISTSRCDAVVNLVAGGLSLLQMVLDRRFCPFFKC